MATQETESARRWREQAIAEGLCPRCRDLPPAKGIKLCRPCALYTADYHRARRAGLKAAGVCQRCGRDDSIRGKTICQQCRIAIAGFRERRKAA